MEFRKLVRLKEIGPARILVRFRVTHTGVKDGHQVMDEAFLDFVEILERQVAFVQLSIDEFLVDDFPDERPDGVWIDFLEGTTRCLH